MTQQEADELTAKLRLIWAPQGNERTEHGLTQKRFRFECEVATDVLLFVFLYLDDTKPPLAALESAACSLECYTNGIEICDIPDNYGNQLHPFATQWMPFFRRGCFLSGCVLECSEHEKLEWMLWLRDKERTLSAA